jgi:kynureninase
VDGAQAFGVIDLDLGAMKPDFYTGSMHKWPCGPKEKGLLYVKQAVHDRVHPSVVGRLRRRGRHIAHARDARPARRRLGRGGHRRVEVPGIDRAPGDREARP